jgi:hypothetical protein
MMTPENHNYLGMRDDIMAPDETGIDEVISRSEVPNLSVAMSVQVGRNFYK